MSMFDCENVTKVFFKSLLDDSYPPAIYEKIFGVEWSLSRSYYAESFPTGELVYNVWVGLWKTKYCSKSEIIQALKNENLPQYFENKVKQQRDDYVVANAPLGEYVPELMKRGFSPIPWDFGAHSLLAGNTIVAWGLRVVGKLRTLKESDELK